jgi:hypothetical protein
LVGYLLHRTVRAPSLTNHVTLGLVCAIFLGSRYSFAVVVVAAVLALAAFRVGRLGRLRDAVGNLAGVTIPILISAAAIYWFTLRHHLAAGLGGAAVQAPEYVTAWVLRGKPLATVAAMVWDNVASPAALPVTLAAAGLVAWPMARRRLHSGEWPGASSFPAVATMAALAQLISAALSASGSYPWHFGQRWSLSLHAVSMVCLLYLGAAAWWWSMQRSRSAVLVAPVLAIAILVTMQSAAYRRVHWADLGPALARLNATALSPGSVLITYFEIPTVRYLYELGPFRGDARYPAAFRFERKAESTTRSPIHAARECLEYVVSPASLDALATRLPGADLTRVQDVQPPYLIGIDAGTRRSPHCPERRGP